MFIFEFTVCKFTVCKLNIVYLNLQYVNYRIVPKNAGFRDNLDMNSGCAGW